DRRDVYDSIATRYDADIAMDELVMGLLLLRRWVVGKAEGDTLELAAGTARNLAYYDPRHVTSLTLTDASDPMLDRARAQLVPNNALKLNTLATARGVTPTTVAIADATGLPYADGTFDTVVSTFSLCSVSDPAAAVREAMRVVRPGGGRVWMLEHGRAHYSWLNRLLDANAPRHADTWGCWFNRDIGDIVTRAVESGQTSAHVERIWRTHFGTTWIVEI
ncbi:S-adenosyl-L-methionine-dependent methyltransferase, partial [Blastocladiella britannica]